VLFSGALCAGLRSAHFHSSFDGFFFGLKKFDYQGFYLYELLRVDIQPCFRQLSGNIAVYGKRNVLEYRGIHRLGDEQLDLWGKRKHTII
jgi:hypothetical protein